MIEIPRVALALTLCHVGVSLRMNFSAAVAAREVLQRTERCAGSGDLCAGNQCCPGYGGSGDLTFPCPNADDTWTGCQTSTKFQYEDVSGGGEPHIVSTTGEKFDLYRTGWSTFVQIPKHIATDEHARLHITGNVRADGSGDECAPVYLHEVAMTGSMLKHTTVLLRAGPLESSAPFSVSVNGSAFEEITDASGTYFLSTPALSLRGEINSEDPDLWDPDAAVLAMTGNMEILVRQHTEARGGNRRSTLDLGVRGLNNLQEPVGGWLGVDGSLLAGEAPDRCSKPSKRSLSGVSVSLHRPDMAAFRSPTDIM